MAHRCKYCTKTYVHVRNLTNHIEDKHKEKQYSLSIDSSYENDDSYIYSSSEDENPVIDLTLSKEYSSSSLSEDEVSIVDLDIIRESKQPITFTDREKMELQFQYYISKKKMDSLEQAIKCLTVNNYKFENIVLPYFEKEKKRNEIVRSIYNKNK